MTRRILLIDLSHLFWASYHASADKDVSYALQWTLEQVAKLASGYEHVAICCDHPPYLRRQAYPEYKAQREAQPPMAIEQFRRTKEQLAQDGYLLWSYEGYEADDVIATACRFAAELSEEAACGITIASNDKDLLQLVSDDRDVCVVSTLTGAEMREAQVHEKFGVDPWQMRDFLALCGDKSDNIPGCPGVGKVHAARLLTEFSGVPTLYDRLEFVKPDGLREKLRMHKAQVDLSRELVTLRTDVPLEFEQIFERRERMIVVDAEFDDETTTEPESEPVRESGEQRAPSAPPPPIEVAQQTKALAKVEAPKAWTLALEPQDSGGAVKLANLMFQSRMFGGFPNPEAILAIILRGRALGLDATTALSTFHCIEGRPSMHATLIVGLVLRSGLADYFELIESTSERAVYATRRAGRPREITMEYTIDEARQAGLLRPSKSGKPTNWETRPKTMLRWRAATELARAVYPDVVAGLYTPDELSDGQAA